MESERSTGTTVATGGESSALAARFDDDPRPPALAELGIALACLSLGAQFLQRAVKRMGGPARAAREVQRATEAISYMESGATVEQIEGSESDGDSTPDPDVLDA